MAQVFELQPRERIVIDTARLDALCRRLGQNATEVFVIERVEQITDRLAEIDWQNRSDLISEAQLLARQVAVIAGEIGLVSLARVAADLAASAGAGDRAAYRAVWERLVRIGDESLANVWESPSLQM